jgi:hypothetical protein
MLLKEVGVAKVVMVVALAGVLTLTGLGLTSTLSPAGIAPALACGTDGDSSDNGEGEVTRPPAPRDGDCLTRF